MEQAGQTGANKTMGPADFARALLRIHKTGLKALFYAMIGALIGAGVVAGAWTCSAGTAEARWRAANEDYAATRRLLNDLEVQTFVSPDRASDIVHKQMEVEATLLVWRHLVSSGSGTRKCVNRYRTQMHKLTQLALMTEDGYQQMKRFERVFDDTIEQLEGATQ